jgi:LPPG:FO 2-phospho-L-lactate transferase
MKVVALSGGVGGAKLADGLAQLLSPEDLTIIVNTGDDFEHLGLYICPDLDTVCYTLAGLSNTETGWGCLGDTFQVLENIQQIGGPGWFHIGDKDFSTHLERTRRLKDGQLLSEITKSFCQSWGIENQIIPMSNNSVRTVVEIADNGDLPFQEYFVHQKCEPKVKGFRFAGIESAQPAPGILESIEQADIIVFCPSNPLVSIDPIINIAGIRTSLIKKTIIAVSPIIGGRTIKGPAAKMMTEIGIEPSSINVAHYYGKLLAAYIMDEEDTDLADRLLIPVVITHTIMKTREERYRLAQDVLNLTEILLHRAS